MDSASRPSEADPIVDGRLLYLAAELGMLEAVQQLASQGASLEHRGPGGHTPLSLACGLSDRSDIALSLVSLGANANARADGGTALHYAAMFGSQELVQKLLEAGADPLASLADSDSSTPMQIASRAPIVRVFENYVGRFSGWIEFKIRSSSDLPVLRWLSLMPYRPVGENRECWLLVLYQDDSSYQELKTFPLLDSTVELRENKYLWLTSPSKKTMWNISSPTEPLQILRLYTLCSVLRYPRILVRTSTVVPQTEEGDPPPIPLHQTVEMSSMPPSVGDYSLVRSESKEVLGSDGTVLCSNCGKKAVKAACVPCGHMTNCHNCLRNLWLTRKPCPIGGCRIESVIKIFKL